MLQIGSIQLQRLRTRISLLPLKHIVLDLLFSYGSHLLNHCWQFEPSDFSHLFLRQNTAVVKYGTMYWLRPQTHPNNAWCYDAKIIILILLTRAQHFRTKTDRNPWCVQIAPWWFCWTMGQAGHKIQACHPRRGPRYPANYSLYFPLNLISDFKMLLVLKSLLNWGICLCAHSAAVGAS